MTTFLRDTATVFTREFRPSLRNPAGLLFEMGQPLLFLFLFGSLLDGAVGASWQWFVPGILVMMCLTGPLSSGYNLLVELIGGSMERLMVTPVDRTERGAFARGSTSRRTPPASSITSAGVR